MQRKCLFIPSWEGVQYFNTRRCIYRVACIVERRQFLQQFFFHHNINILYIVISARVISIITILSLYTAIYIDYIIIGRCTRTIQRQYIYIYIATDELFIRRAWCSPNGFLDFIPNTNAKLKKMATAGLRVYWNELVIFRYTHIYIYPPI